MPSPYTKQYATPAALVAHLLNRGLTIPNPAFAENKIDEIGYNRLRIYLLSRRQKNAPGKPFLPGITFEDIIALYELDDELRMRCFRYVGQFEILFRNALSESLSRRHGAHPYSDSSIYQDARAATRAVKCMTDAFLSKIDKDQRAKHYSDNYNDPLLPPIWSMKEFMTFGAVNSFYGNLSNVEKTEISKLFGIINFELFGKWVNALIDLRNICAHHDRLFNHRFQKQPERYRAAGVPSAAQNTLKGLLECLEYLLRARGFAVPVVADIDAVIRSCPSVRPGEAGF